MPLAEVREEVVSQGQDLGKGKGKNEDKGLGLGLGFGRAGLACIEGLGLSVRNDKVEPLSAACCHQRAALGKMHAEFAKEDKGSVTFVRNGLGFGQFRLKQAVPCLAQWSGPWFGGMVGLLNIQHSMMPNVAPQALPKAGPTSLSLIPHLDMTMCAPRAMMSPAVAPEPSCRVMRCPSFPPGNGGRAARVSAFQPALGTPKLKISVQS